MSQDCVFDQRWEFRRKESDLDSSSEDKGSSSARDQKLEKCAPLLSLVPAEDEEEETSHNRELVPPEGAENRPNPMKNTQDKRIKKNNNHRHGPRIAKTKRGSKKIEHGHNLTAELHGLETHVNVLVKELNTSREGFMKWMADELEKLIPDSASASPSKSARKGKIRQGQETKKRKANKRGELSKKKPKVNGRSSKKVNANDSSKVAVEQNKAAQVCVEEAQEAEEAANLSKTPTVLALAGDKMVRESGMLPVENQNRAYIASNYLNLPNLNPRPLAENYLVKPSSSTVRLQPVVLDSQRDALSAQQQSAAYYQGVTLQPERDFSRPDMCSTAGFDRTYSGPLNGSLGSHGGFPSTGHLGLKGGFNIHNMGLGGLEASAQENNFPSLRMMRFFGGSHGVRDDDMNSNHLKYSSLREN